MAMVMFTRPDGSPVGVSVGDILSFAPCPTDGPLAGPPAARVRIQFRSGAHQDVSNSIEEVGRRLGVVA